MDISKVEERKLEGMHKRLKNNVAERQRLLAEDQAALDEFEAQLTERRDKEKASD